MALSVEEKLQIMEKALREGYDGYMTDLWAQADPEEAAMAQELDSVSPDEPDMSPNLPTGVQLPPPSEPSSPGFQSLVQSYEAASPAEQPKGETVQSTLEDPSSYRKGGYKLRDSIDLKLDFKGIDPRAHIDNYTKNYKYKELGGMAQTSDAPLPKPHDPISFAEYYYTSPKHQERMIESGYSDEEIKDRSGFLEGEGPTISTGSVEGSRSYPESNKIIIDPEVDKEKGFSAKEVLAHELGHLSTGFEGLNKTDKKEILDRNQLLQKGGKISSEGSPDRYAMEVKSDLDAIRYMLFSAGIYDAGIEDFDFYDMTKAQELLKDSEIWKRMMKDYNENDFMWLMNNVAMGDPTDEMADDTAYAQDGGFKKIIEPQGETLFPDSPFRKEREFIGPLPGIGSERTDYETKKKIKLHKLEQDINKLLGDPMERASKTSGEILEGFSGEKKGGLDALRHTLAGMYTSEKVGPLLTNIFGLGHEAMTKNTPSEHLQDLGNNLIGSLIAKIPFMGTKKREKVAKWLYNKGYLFKGTDKERQGGGFKNIKDASKKYADDWGIKNKEALKILKGMDYNVSDTLISSQLNTPIGGDSMLRSENKFNVYNYMTELYPEIIGSDGNYDMELMDQKMQEHGYMDEFGNISDYKKYETDEGKLHISKLKKKRGGLRRFQGGGEKKKFIREPQEEINISSPYEYTPSGPPIGPRSAEEVGPEGGFYTDEEGNQQFKMASGAIHYDPLGLAPFMPWTHAVRGAKHALKPAWEAAKRGVRKIFPKSPRPRIINKSNVDLGRFNITTDDVVKTGERIEKRLMTDKFINNNMKATGRSREEVINSIKGFSKEFDNSTITFKDLGVDGPAARYIGNGKIAVNSSRIFEHTNKKQILGNIEHEIEHLFSDATGRGWLQAGKQVSYPSKELYKKYPSLKVTDDIGQGNYRKMYHELPFEQQVRFRKSIKWMEDNIGLKVGDDITDAHIDKLSHALKNWSKSEAGKDFGGIGGKADVYNLLSNLDFQQMLPRDGSVAALFSKAPMGSKYWKQTMKDVLNATYATIPATFVLPEDEKRYGGYKRNSPDRHRRFNIIPSNQITMKGVDFPVLGIDNLGNKKRMKPGKDYTFPGNYVIETPIRTR